MKQKFPNTTVRCVIVNLSDCEFDQSPKLSIENPNEALGQEMILKEIGQYLCSKCNSKVGEYREFEKL